MTRSCIAPAPGGAFERPGVIDYFDEIDTMSFLVRSAPRRDPAVPERLFGIDTRLYGRGTFALRIALFGGYGATGAVRDVRVEN